MHYIIHTVGLPIPVVVVSGVLSHEQYGINDRYVQYVNTNSMLLYTLYCYLPIILIAGEFKGLVYF